MDVYDLIREKDLPGLQARGEIEEEEGQSILMYAWRVKTSEEVMTYLLQHGASLSGYTQDTFYTFHEMLEENPTLNQLAYLAVEGDPRQTLSTTQDVVQLSQQLDYLFTYEPDSLHAVLAELDPATPETQQLVEQYRAYVNQEWDQLAPFYLLDDQDRRVLLNYPLIYRNIKPLGQGAFGQVVLAERRLDSTQVAIKTFFDTVRSASDEDEDALVEWRDARDNFDHEKYFSSLVNPGPRCQTKYVCYLDSFLIYAWNRIRPLLVYNYLPGISLEEYIQTKDPTWPDTLSLMQQIVGLALDLSQQGIEHRDFHAGNLILHQGQLTLIDFGMACRIEGGPYECQNDDYQAYASLRQFVFLLRELLGPFRNRATDLAACLDDIMRYEPEDVSSVDLSAWYQLIQNKLDRISQRK